MPWYAWGLRDKRNVFSISSIICGWKDRDKKNQRWNMFKYRYHNKIKHDNYSVPVPFKIWTECYWQQWEFLRVSNLNLRIHINIIPKFLNTCLLEWIKLVMEGIELLLVGLVSLASKLLTFKYTVNVPRTFLYTLSPQTLKDLVVLQGTRLLLCLCFAEDIVLSALHTYIRSDSSCIL